LNIYQGGVKVLCKNNCKLGEKKNMNLPGAIIDLPTLTDRDEDDIVRFRLKKGIDLIAASFVRKASQILTTLEMFWDQEDAHVKIIAKIENQEGL